MRHLLERMSTFILQHPRQLLLGSLLFVLVFVPGVARLTTNFGIRIWLPPDNPLMRPLDDFERHFGNDEAVVVVVSDAQGIFTPRTVNVLSTLTTQLERVEGVKRVDSLANYRTVYGSDDAITIEPFLAAPADRTANWLAEKRAKALDDKVIVGYLLDAKAQTSLLYAWLQPTLTQEPNYKQIMQDIRALVAPYHNDASGLRLYLTGAGALNDAFREASEKDLVLTFPLLIVLIVLLLWGLYRRLVFIVLPLLLIVMTTTVAFGFLGYVGIEINNLLSVLPFIIIAISIADTIHITNDFTGNLRRGLDRATALRETVEANLLPTFLTCATTAVGFDGLVITPLIPIQHLVIGTTIAVVCALCLTYTLVVPALQLLPDRFLHAPESHATYVRLERFLPRYITFLEAHTRSVFAIGILVGVVCLYYTLQLRVDSEPNAYFAEKVPIKIANDVVYKAIGGFNGPEIVLDSGRPGGAKSLDFLRRVEALETWIDGQPYVNQTISLIDTIKTVHRALHADDPQLYVLADAEDVVAQEIFAYTLGVPEGRSLEDLMDIQERFLRLSVYWRLTKSSDSLTALEAIQGKMAALGLQGEVTGKYFILYRLNTFVVQTLFLSVVISFTVVAFVMMWLCRSVRLGCGAIAANVIPLFIGGMIIFWLGKSVNFGTAMVMSICLGIAVDDTIHFCASYFHYRAAAQTPRDVLLSMFRSAGTSMLITNLLLVTGFGAFVLGDFIPNVELGLFCCIILMVAVLFDLIWIPCVLLRYDAYRPVQGAVTELVS